MIEQLPEKSERIDLVIKPARKGQQLGLEFLWPREIQIKHTMFVAAALAEVLHAQAEHDREAVAERPQRAPHRYASSRKRYPTPRTVKVTATKDDGASVEFDAVVRIDTPGEADYYRNGGILQYVLRNLVNNN